jgi:hypothetical protein
MYFHRGKMNDLQGIPDRIGVMRPGAGVEHYRLNSPTEPVKVLHKLSLVVRVKERSLKTEPHRSDPHLVLELRQGDSAVVSRIPTS